jgi:hypothetical protein
MPFFAISQSNYKKGFLVTDNGDPLNGFINYREWTRNPQKVTFSRRGEDVDARTFSANETKSFAVEGYESYASFTVSISTAEITFGRLSEVADPNTITKRIFLKELLKGDRVNLYSYTDEIKQRFYLLSNNQTTPAELIYRKTLKDQTEEVTQALFKEQLLKLAIEYGTFTADLDRYIQTADFSANTIKKIVSKINTRNETSFTNAIDKKRKSNFFVSVGVHNSLMNYSGESKATLDGVNDMGGNKYKKVNTQSILPRLAAGMDFYINPAVRKFVIRTELAVTSLKSSVNSYYKYNNYSSEEIRYTYRFSALNIAFSPQVVYNLYNTAKFKYYLGAGAAFNYMHVKDNSIEGTRYSQTGNTTETQNDYFILKEFYLSPIVRTGAQINQKLDLSVLWGSSIEYTNYFIGTASMKGGLLAFAIGFYFGK